ncbi:MAG TPA: amidohydrolase family protein [Methylomusa anaerophila]|uniref:Imidazolonepropionase n=1 Tax=Methylomusa anaerophila TaxID=1930071 RepID=A0A348AF74_9FIRM|nr:amidohydrolase family protein [Methylomusa anaerophila]BBB89722.1 imidazolonepropionase [Methylomusa anaerophila]HML89233.1 amidohydrolase family protein [Methylomusa anaerophila]
MLVKAGLLIDGTGNEPQADACFAVEKGRIIAIGRIRDFSSEQVANAVDYSGFTVLPGLIDTHVHLFLEGIFDLKERSLRWKDEKDITLIRAVKNIARTIQHGVTTIRDLGGPHNINTVLKQAVRRSVISGPRVLTCNRAISITGGHFHYAGGREADGAEEMVKAVREQARAGADCIKVMMTGCVDFNRQDAGTVELSRIEAEMLFKEASKLGKPVAVHANGIEGVRQALACGATTVEHGALLKEETVEEIVRSSAYWIPTLIPFQRMLDYSEEYNTKSLPYDGIHTVYARHREMVGRAAKMGARIVAGTDAGALGVEHGDLWWEISLLIECGLSAGAAIHAATGLAAQAIGIADEVGTLEVGKRADFIVVNGNPLQEIKNLNKINKVYKDGHLVYQ